MQQILFIMCLLECGEVNVLNGKIESISSNGSVLTTACTTGYQTDTYTSVCQTNGSWSNDIICTTPGELVVLYYLHL